MSGHLKICVTWKLKAQAKKGKSKTPADDFWRAGLYAQSQCVQPCHFVSARGSVVDVDASAEHYDGFGQRHISFSWPDEAGGISRIR